jgi:hypothetical protein
MIPPEQVDQAILARCKSQYRKVALIMVQVGDDLKVPMEGDHSFISDRIKALVKAERLQSQGNLNRPRFSEIRLPQK